MKALPHGEMRCSVFATTPCREFISFLLDLNHALLWNVPIASY